MVLISSERLAEVLLMNTHNTCFCRQIKKKIYIEAIQMFGVNMTFISLSEVKKIYIS